MNILEGALAFTVVMIVLATIASGMTEAWLRTRRKRQVLLAQALAQMLLEEERSNRLKPSALDRDRWCDRLVDHLTYNPVFGSLDDLLGRPGLRGSLIRWWTDLFATSHYRIAAAARARASRPQPEPDQGVLRLRDWHRVDVLTPQGFAERLARLEPYGSQLTTETAWRDLINTYARYRLLSQERFRKSAQALSIVMAFGLAIVFNIDAGRIFVHVMTDTDARDALVAAAPEVIASYGSLQARRDAATDPALIARLDAELAELRAVFDDNLEILTRDAGLPIGLTYYPHCLFAPEISQLQQLIATGQAAGNAKPVPAPGCVVNAENIYAGLPIWFLNVLIAGFLIGLGGPFWYRVFSGLSQLTQLLKRVGGGQPPAETLSQAETGAEGRPSLEEEVEAAVKAALAIRKIKADPT